MPRWPPRNGDVPSEGKHVPGPPALIRDGRLLSAEKCRSCCLTIEKGDKEQAMKELTDSDYRLVQKTANGIVRKHGLKDTALSLANPFLFALFVPASNGKRKVEKACNEICHELGVLPIEKALHVGECSDYCSLLVDGDGFDFIAEFNHPIAKSFTGKDEESKFTLKGIFAAYAAEVEEKEQRTKALLSAIKDGKLKSKSGAGYLVLAGEFYDAIETGSKKVEYRNFSANNLRRTIGIKTIRFNRGYGSKGRSPKQMRWEVKKVMLVDDGNRACDPMRVPEDFWPTAIAIHLGKRIR